MASENELMKARVLYVAVLDPALPVWKAWGWFYDDGERRVFHHCRLEGPPGIYYLF